MKNLKHQPEFLFTFTLTRDEIWYESNPQLTFGKKTLIIETMVDCALYAMIRKFDELDSRLSYISNAEYKFK